MTHCNQWYVIYARALPERQLNHISGRTNYLSESRTPVDQQVVKALAL